MSADLRFAPAAKTDILGAYIWYEGRRLGLGEEFLSCVEACLENIRRNPRMFNVVHEDYRRALVRRFPYAIFYEHSENAVIIYGVLHTAQDPNKWRERLP